MHGLSHKPSSRRSHHDYDDSRSGRRRKDRDGDERTLSRGKGKDDSERHRSRRRREDSGSTRRERERKEEAERSVDTLVDVHATAFEDGEDFIAFAPTPPSSPPPPSPSEKGKGREKERNGAHATSSRERDRGKPNGGYDMVFDFNDSGNTTRRRHHTDAASRKAPWTANIDWDRCNNVAEMCAHAKSPAFHSDTSRHCRLHCEVDAFLRYISPTRTEDELRGLVVQLVSRAITQAFPDATVRPFGSYATKLYLPSGHVLRISIRGA
jgi:non-canonical poly(A) RNA polymerase PAPD5/7